MTSLIPVEANCQGQDLPNLGERILRTLLTAPAQRIEMEQALAKLRFELHDPEMNRHATELASLSAALTQQRETITTRCNEAKDSSSKRTERQRSKLDTNEKVGLLSLSDYRDTQIDSIEQTTEESKWTADAIYESLEPQPGIEFKRARSEIDQSVQEIIEQVQQVEKLLQKARIGLAPIPMQEVDLSHSTPRPHLLLSEQLDCAKVTLKDLRCKPLNIFARNWAAHLALLILLSASFFVVIFLTAGRETTQDFRILILAGLVICLIQSGIWIWAGIRLKPSALIIATVQLRTREAGRIALEALQLKRSEQEKVFLNQHQKEHLTAQQAMNPKRVAIEEFYRKKYSELVETADRLRRNAVAQYETAIIEIEQDATRAFEKAHQTNDLSLLEEENRHKGRIVEIAAVLSMREQTLRSQWKQSRDQVFIDTQQTMNLDRKFFPSWTDDLWEQFCGRTTSSGAAKIGTVTVTLNSIPGALPVDPDLAWPSGSPRIIHVPIALTFPSRASLLIETNQEGRSVGTALLQETILQILTALPPGQARFTIIDPVGLGEGFAAFMHLADEAEHLIGERIWTDSRRIEQKLTDLCEHMETVIQKFLRNEFADLDQYNQQAGEIAEPYRFLVIADFPTGLTDIAAKRLASIVNSGTRCGVFTIILRDLRQPLPPEIDIADIRSRSLCVHWKENRFVVSAEPFCHFPFTPGSIPESEKTISLLKRIALTAKNSKKVQVPFSAIAPKDNALWSESTAQSITIPLGRSGATRLQSITLGVGTSQHALIAGKTGSGKSTLLHALITNLALRYSPDEAELWLIDFKKGVEFRTYATNRLPHARAVAVESDREFGLSVLRGLDAELRRRGEIFRDRSVQDLGGYRRIGASEKIPRTLLIVDEFQELFTEDDKVSEESALLLDRLVRQGRAFGIHVILGSQTLGGAYSIARATMGQMAIRIALQCNEADSQLILSDDNVAARLLSRPGEAIYNDAGGLIEGNNPFQVVWLPDDERDQILAKIRKRNESHPTSDRPQMIVFEGSAPANLETNQILRAAKLKRDRGETSGPGLLWFGDAISIKDPTAVILRRQSGTNIMLVGQREDAALGISAGVLVSLAAQYKSGGCQLFLLDGTPPDDENFGRLGALQERLQISGASGGLRDANSVLEKVTAELLRRQSEQSSQSPPCVILVHAIHRFRTLRRNEDDFGYSSSGDAPPTPDKLLATLLREGPALGIHVMVTCDGATNLGRSFDRNSIREFEWRLLFQVSASDSSTLIDSPIASRLGPQRVILHSEETGTQEKFRPYAWPSTDWLDRFFPRQ